jgi:hypothetical protein
MKERDTMVDASSSFCIEGDAFALARVAEACKLALRAYEFNGKDTHEKMIVNIPGPDPTGS